MRDVFLARQAYVHRDEQHADQFGGYAIDYDEEEAMDLPDALSVMPWIPAPNAFNTRPKRVVVFASEAEADAEEMRMQKRVKR